MPDEFISFRNILYSVVSLVGDTLDSLKRCLLTQLLTDSKEIIYVVSNGSSTSEKRTILDTATSMEEFGES